MAFLSTMCSKQHIMSAGLKSEEREHVCARAVPHTTITPAAMPRLSHVIPSGKLGRPLTMGHRGRLPLLNTLISVLILLSFAPP